MDQPLAMTALLRRYRAGDSAAGEELLPVVYEHLHDLAERAIAGREAGNTLQATALLHEAWLRLQQADGVDYESRDHFYAVAARAMRCVLVDRARRRAATKRGGDRARIELDEFVDRLEERSGPLLALDAALERLQEAEPEFARIVELRFFGGMKHPAIATVLGVPLRRVERGWASARAWLYSQLEGECAEG